jgi:hypothetical protein
MDDEVLAAIAAAELSHERKAGRAMPAAQPPPTCEMPELPVGISPMPVRHMDFGCGAGLPIPVNTGAQECRVSGGEQQLQPALTEAGVEGCKTSPADLLIPQCVIVSAAAMTDAVADGHGCGREHRGVGRLGDQLVLPSEVSQRDAEKDAAGDGHGDERAHQAAHLQPAEVTDKGKSIPDAAVGANKLPSALSILNGRRARPGSGGGKPVTPALQALQTDVGEKFLPITDLEAANEECCPSLMVMDSLGTLPLPECPPAAPAVRCSQDVPTPETETNDGMSEKSLSSWCTTSTWPRHGQLISATMPLHVACLINRLLGCKAFEVAGLGQTVGQ